MSTAAVLRPKSTAVMLLVEMSAVVVVDDEIGVLESPWYMAKETVPLLPPPVALMTSSSRRYQTPA